MHVITVTDSIAEMVASGAYCPTVNYHDDE